MSVAAGTINSNQDKTEDNIPVTQTDAVNILREECKKAGSQTKWAKAHGVHRALVQRILAGKQNLEPSIILALGMRRTIAYEYAREMNMTGYREGSI